MSTAPRRALIVIDVQNEYVDGNLLIEYPPVAESLANIARAIDAAQQAGIPVVVVQNDAPASSPLFAIDSHGWQLHPVVESRTHDRKINKTLPSAFAGTDLAEWLASRQVDTVTIAGYMTHNCNASTIMHAEQAGFTVEFLQDASGSVPYKNEAGSASAEEIHRVFSVVFHSRFAATASTAAWISAVEAGVPLAQGNIWNSNQDAIRQPTLA